MSVKKKLEQAIKQDADLKSTYQDILRLRKQSSPDKVIRGR